MQILQNLVPDPSTPFVFVPRPGSVQLTDFSGLDAETKGAINALLTVGAIAYGMIAETSGTYSGKDVPFAYNTATNSFIAITIPGGASSLPTTPATSGDWTPPCMALVGSTIIITHPGYPGGVGAYFGWLDLSGLNDTSHTGDTHSNNLIDNLSANVLLAGWQVGDKITGTDIPANTYILTIAANGLSLTISNVATGTTATVNLTVTGGTTAAPLYGAGNTNGNALIAVPVSVAQFYGRAYYAVGNAIVFSDSGFARQVTNATQVLTPANGLAVTALAGLPLSSPLTGGIIQSLMAFQGDTVIQQITGDASTTPSSLAMNALNVATGTLAPLTITPTPLGLAFVSPHGVFFIGFDAGVKGPLGANGQGVQVPFLNVLHPSRMAACFNQNVLRISLKNPNAAGQPTQEYWYDFTNQAWSGPHSFPAAVIQPLQTTAASFLMMASGINGKLWQSDVVPVSTSAITENGSPINYVFQTTLMPDNQEMSENAIIEATLACNLGQSTTVSLQALDETGTVLDTLTLMGNPGGASLWGTFVWGVDPWLGDATFFAQIPLDWHQPIIFKQAAIRISGQAEVDLAIGNLYMRYEALGYLLQGTG